MLKGRISISFNDDVCHYPFPRGCSSEDDFGQGGAKKTTQILSSDLSLAMLVSDPLLYTDGVVLMSALVEGNEEVESSPSYAVIEGRCSMF